MTPLWALLCGLLLIQAIRGTKINQESHKAPKIFAIPATPALSINPEKDDDVGDVPFSIPAIPAMELTPENQKLFEEHFEKYSKFGEHFEHAYAIPATPALRINPEEDSVRDSPFSIPAIPAMELSPEEQKLLKEHFEKYGKFGDNFEHAYAIPATPALSINPEKYYVEDSHFSIPAIPAMELSPEEQKLLQEKYGKFGEDSRFTYALPAIPAFRIDREGSNIENPRFSIPAIPAMEASPEEQKLFQEYLKRYGNIGDYSKFSNDIPPLSTKPESKDDVRNPPFSEPAIPAMELSPEEQKMLQEHFDKYGKFEEDSRFAYAIPATPALSINPKDDEHVGNFPFSIPAIPAMKLSPEEQKLLKNSFEENGKFGRGSSFEESIPAIPAMTISRADFLKNAEYEKLPNSDGYVFSIPAIPAMRISPEDSDFLNYAENGVYSIPAIPALKLDSFSNDRSYGIDNEPFMIPATPAITIYPESHKGSNKDFEFFQGPYANSIPAIPAMSLESLAEKTASIPETPEVNISDKPRSGSIIEELGAEMKRCMNVVKSLQKIPRMARNAFQASANATKVGLPLLKNILECSKGDLMDTMVCLGDKEADIRDFVLLLNKLVHPHLVTLYEEGASARKELFACLQINNNSTITNSFLNNFLKMYK